MLFTFFLLWQNERQEELQAGRVYLGSQFEGAVHRGEEGIAVGAGGSWSHRVYGQEAERHGCWNSARSLLFNQLINCGQRD